MFTALMSGRGLEDSKQSVAVVSLSSSFSSPSVSGFLFDLKILVHMCSLDAPLTDDEDFTLGHLLATGPSHDNPTTNRLPSALGIQPRLEPETLQRAICDGKGEFKRLLGPLHDVLVTVCGLFVASPDELRTGDPARAVAAARGTSVQTARRKLRELAAIFRRALQTCNSTVKDLHTMLTTPGRPTFWINGTRSGRPQAA